MLVGQIVDQGMQVRFTHLGCFIEEEGQIIAEGRKDRRMFILNTNDVGTALFAKGQKIELDINLWQLLGNREEDQVPAVGWRKRILLRPIQQLSTKKGDSKRIKLQIHTRT